MAKVGDNINADRANWKFNGDTSKNFDEHVKYQVGDTLAKMFFTNYPLKIWGMRVY